MCYADYPDSTMATVTTILFEHCHKFADINISIDQNVDNANLK